MCHKIPGPCGPVSVPWCRGCWSCRQGRQLLSEVTRVVILVVARPRILSHASVWRMWRRRLRTVAVGTPVGGLGFRQTGEVQRVVIEWRCLCSVRRGVVSCFELGFRGRLWSCLICVGLGGYWCKMFKAASE